MNILSFMKVTKRSIKSKVHFQKLLDGFQEQQKVKDMYINWKEKLDRTKVD